MLVDTYDTLHAVRAIVSAGLRPGAVRLDSGDFGPLSREVRAILDAGGLRGTKILASGDLDEDRIAALVASGAPIDAFGVGTTLSTSRDSPALGGVYKLVETERDGVRRPVMKLSPGKHTLAGVKQVWRTPAAGAAVGDVIGLSDEAHHDGRPLLQQVMKGGQPVGTIPSVHDARAYCQRRVAELPGGVKRLREWEDYAVTMSEALAEEADGEWEARRDGKGKGLRDKGGGRGLGIRTGPLLAALAPSPSPFPFPLTPFPLPLFPSRPSTY